MQVSRNNYCDFVAVVKDYNSVEYIGFGRILMGCFREVTLCKEVQAEGLFSS